MAPGAGLEFNPGLRASGAPFSRDDAVWARTCTGAGGRRSEFKILLKLLTSATLKLSPPSLPDSLHNVFRSLFGYSAVFCFLVNRHKCIYIHELIAPLVVLLA